LLFLKNEIIDKLDSIPLDTHHNEYSWTSRICNPRLSDNPSLIWKLSNAPRLVLIYIWRFNVQHTINFGNRFTRSILLPMPTNYNPDGHKKAHIGFSGKLNISEFLAHVDNFFFQFTSHAKSVSPSSDERVLRLPAKNTFFANTIYNIIYTYRYRTRAPEARLTFRKRPTEFSTMSNFSRFGFL
jgi:hypothetical protein